MRVVLLLAATSVLAWPLGALAVPSPTAHARHVVAFFDHHRASAKTPAGQRALWKAIHALSAATRTIDNATPTYPPHHALWECIHRGEASSWASESSNGHYGGLQMTYGWLGYINGNPASYTQAEQEWAAEKAWAANGYSYSFLYGQWYEWDNADGCGTTG